MCAEEAENFIVCNVVLFSVPFEEDKAALSKTTCFAVWGFGFMFTGTSSSRTVNYSSKGFWVFVINGF